MGSSRTSFHHPCSHGFVGQRKSRSSAWKQPACVQMASLQLPKSCSQPSVIAHEANAAGQATTWAHLAAQLTLDVFGVSSHGKKRQVCCGVAEFCGGMAPPTWLFGVWVILASLWRVARDVEAASCSCSLRVRRLQYGSLGWALTTSLVCPPALQTLTPTGGTPSPPDQSAATHLLSAADA